MMNRNQKNVIFTTFACFCGYFLFGFMDNLKGAALSPLLQDMNYSYSFGGTIVMFGYMGLFTSSLLSGILADKYSGKFTLLMAGISMFIGVIGYAAAYKMILFKVCMFLIGFSCGSLELSGSNIISEIHADHKGKYSNLPIILFLCCD